MRWKPNFKLIPKFESEFERNFWQILWPILIVILLLASSYIGPLAHASNVRYSGRLSPKDYLWGSQEQHGDPFFDSSKPIDLNVSMGVNTDCGNINFQATLQSTMDQILKNGFLGDFAKRMIDATPMLTICYLSPTLCAILKHSQLSANMVSQLRLNQCALVDKYVDSRVEDYYQERQSCIHQAIRTNGGNMDAAMESCGGSGAANLDLSNWAGSRYGDKVTTNKLIDSSAKWAGMDGGNSNSPLNLVKALVGDTVLSKGSVSVEYGPRGGPLTPRTYLQSLERTTYDELCNKILGKIINAGPQTPIDQIVSDTDLRNLSSNSDQLLVDRQTLRALSYMSPKQQRWACKKLADASAMTLFSTDINRSLDVLTTLSQNPNLPAKRKQEIEDKRRALKEQIEMTVALQKQRSEPLNQVVSHIQEEGNRLQSEAVADGLDSDTNSQANHRNQANLLDCSDGVMCE